MFKNVVSTLQDLQSYTDVNPHGWSYKVKHTIACTVCLLLGHDVVNILKITPYDLHSSVFW
jgi:hypothetical protein